MVAKKTFKSLIVAPATTALIATSAHAGGLADAITEAPVVEEVAPAPSGSANWVVPALAVLLLGIAIASSGDDDDDEDTDPMTSTLSSMF